MNACHNIIFSTVQDGASPLHIASQEGEAEVVDTLLKNGADPNVVMKVWETSVHISIFLFKCTVC